MKRIVLIGVLAFGLSACAQLGALTNGSSSDVRMPIGKGLLVAEQATIGVNVGAIAAANSNLCHGACAVSLKAKIDALNKGVSLAYKAWLDGNSALAGTLLSDAFTQIGDAAQQTKTGSDQ